MSQRFFAAFVQRTAMWDPALTPQQQQGFPDHAKFVAELEATGFIAMAGLMSPSNEVLFVFRADSEAEVRQRMARDPWQQAGYVRLARVEEVQFRIGTPGG